MSDISKQSIAIGILARDCADGVIRNKPRIEQLRRLFGVSYVVIVENDSKDDTKAELKRYASESEDVTVISQDFGGRYPFHFSETPVRPDMSCHRIARMSYVRNMLIDYIERNYNCDYVMLLDIDVQWFSVQGIADAIANAPSDWGALFANGREYISVMGKTFASEAQYDTYAMLFQDEQINRLPVSITKPLTKLCRGLRVNSWLKRNPYVRMQSAFGGVGIYRSEAIRNLRYDICIPDDWKGLGISLCEHVPFNAQVKGSCYISRALEVRYHTDSLSNPDNDIKRRLLLLFLIIKHYFS